LTDSGKICLQLCKLEPPVTKNRSIQHLLSYFLAAMLVYVYTTNLIL